ncbi:MAG: hypothetical protein JO208_13255 [Alphaproteobacteria bacterium]|nr:hypothetical protein [Alphaproteobacteria bacterium]
MAKTSPRQRKTIGRVMHEYKHGELKRSRSGKGGKVKNRRQAIAIALGEAGASKYESKSENKRDFERTKRKERRGETGQQAREGKSRIGARGRRESSRAMGGKNATRTASRRRTSGRSNTGPTRAELYQRAKRKHIRGASRMKKAELRKALQRS